MDEKIFGWPDSSRLHHPPAAPSSPVLERLAAIIQTLKL
jgi:hypothetical protein